MATDEPDPPDDAPPTTPGADEPAEPSEPADDAGDGAGDAPPSLSNLRVKDMVNRSREELEAELDPATMAELASWFGRPNLSEAREREVPEELRARAANDLDQFERLGAALGALEEEDRSDVQARAMAAVQPRMLELFDRHHRAADTIRPARPELQPTIDETLVPASVRAMLPTDDDQPKIGEPREIEIPRDIANLLEHDNAPQAVLRDLNRPVEEFERRLEPAFPPTPPEQDMTFAIRDALRWRPEPVPVIEPLMVIRREWRPFLTQPWAEVVAAAIAARKAEVAEADRIMQAEAEAGIVYRW